MPKKTSEFQQDSDVIELYPRATSQLDDSEMVALDAEDNSTWSWNPLDWLSALRREITTFSLKMTPRRKVLFKAVAGEGLCTFLFMFVVMATAVNNGRQQVQENLVLGAISTAFLSVGLIYSFADVSGAHFNPAVTFACMITGKVSVRKGINYMLVQCFAAVAATIMLLVVFPKVTGTNGSVSIAASVVIDVHPDTSLWHAFFMEFMLTFILVYVVFATAFDTGIRI